MSLAWVCALKNSTCIDLVILVGIRTLYENSRSQTTQISLSKNNIQLKKLENSLSMSLGRMKVTFQLVLF